MRVPAVILFDGIEYAGWIEPVVPRIKVESRDGSQYYVDGIADIDGQFDCPPLTMPGTTAEAHAGTRIFPVIVSQYDLDSDGRHTVRVKSNGAPREQSATTEK